MKAITEMNALEILTEVLESEKENGCADRGRLEKLNEHLIFLTGKTSATLLDELGL